MSFSSWLGSGSWRKLALLSGVPSRLAKMSRSRCLMLLEMELLGGLEYLGLVGDEAVILPDGWGLLAAVPVPDGLGLVADGLDAGLDAGVDAGLEWELVMLVAKGGIILIT